MKCRLSELVKVNDAAGSACPIEIPDPSSSSNARRTARDDDPFNKELPSSIQILVKSSVQGPELSVAIKSSAANLSRIPGGNDSMLRLSSQTARQPELESDGSGNGIGARSASALEIIDDLAVEGVLNIEICSQQEAPVTYLWVRSEQDDAQKSPSRHVTARCAMQGGSISIRCARQTFGSQQVELHTVQHHTASHTTSNVQIHGVSSERSRMTVTSMIHIGPGICGVTAHQIHKHLLLDKGARATTKPMLEVLSDDVSCSHGAAIKALDERQLFYLQSRGCSRENAREMLINAFLEA